MKTLRARLVSWVIGLLEAFASCAYEQAQTERIGVARGKWMREHPIK